MKIYLIRHGETTGDIENRYGGWYDDHLTQKGIKQAEELAQKLLPSGIQNFFSSSLIRARETAEILSKEFNIEVEEVSDLRERNLYGKLGGMVRKEAKKKYPELVEQLKDFRNTIEGAESYQECTDRVLKAFESIANSSYKIVGIISHGGPIKTIFRELLKIEVETVNDCAYAVLEVTPESIKFTENHGVILNGKK